MYHEGLCVQTHKAEGQEEKGAPPHAHFTLNINYSGSAGTETAHHAQKSVVLFQLEKIYKNWISKPVNKLKGNLMNFKRIPKGWGNGSVGKALEDLRLLFEIM